MLNFGLIFLITFISYFSSDINTEEVKFYPCSQNSTVNCQINRVIVDPCPEAEENDPCVLMYGTRSSVYFDYIPKFHSKQLSGRAYSVTHKADLPFNGMDTNACNYTKCPQGANEINSYKYSVDIISAYPPGPYTVKWRLWNEIEQECCFLVQIKIV